MLYADTFGRMVGIAVEQLIGNLRVFLQYWEEIKVVGWPDGKLTNPLSVLLTEKEYFAIDSGCLDTYVSTALGAVQDCHI